MKEAVADAEAKISQDEQAIEAFWRSRTSDEIYYSLTGPGERAL